MSTTGGFTAQSLAALGNNASVSMGWLEMVISGGTSSGNTNSPSTPQTFALRVIEKPANEFVRMITSPLNLISVMGPARSGKSTLMNLLAGCRETELFTTYPGMETFTKGVNIPTRLLTLPEFSSLEGEPVVGTANSNVRVSFVDTEGQGAVGDMYDMNLFSPALVTSRVVLYNRTGGLLTEEILTQLGMMTQAAKRLQVATDTSASAPKGPLFGHLFIIFNQFRLNRFDDATSLKSKLMTEEPEIDSSSKNRNNIRKLLTSVFESIQVFILPDRLKPEARDALSDGTKPFLLIDDFDSKYLEYFKVLRNALSTALLTTRELIAGNPLTGGAIADFMPSFAGAINKSEPLNVPSIFEAAQNDAINKGLVACANSLSLSVESRLKEDAKPTRLLSAQFDQDVQIALGNLSLSISYMPPTVIQTARSEASTSASAIRQNLLDTNLDRLKALMASALTVLLVSIPGEAQKLFPDAQKLLVSQAEVANQVKTLGDLLLADYRAKGDAYDSSSFPPNYEKTVQDALDLQKAILSENVAKAWSTWVAGVEKEMQDALIVKLTTVGQETRVGESQQYTGKVTLNVNEAKTNFGRKLDAEYLWSDKEDQKTKFNGAVDSTAAVQRSLWENNESAVRGQLTAELGHYKELYNIQLQNALTPHKEPEPFETLADAASVRALLTDFCKRNNISDRLASESSHQLELYLASRRSEFRITYDQASTVYSTWILAELGIQKPLLIDHFNDMIEAINLNLSVDIKLQTILTSCTAAQTQVDQETQTVINNLHIQPNGVVSSSIIQSFRHELQEAFDLAKNAKVDKYNEVVSIYNKALLTSIIVPIVDTALDNKYNSVTTLDWAVESAHTRFNNEKRGDGTDSNAKWDNFKDTTYPALVQTVQRFNAYIVPGLDGNLSATLEIQKKVLSNIVFSCGTIANALGMSWVGNDFDPSNPQDMGTTIKDPTQPNQQNSRTLRMINQYVPPADGYNRQYTTNLEFFDWVVEISEIIWGRPIITDLKPVKIDTSEFGAQATPMTVNVGAISTETTTIRDSQSWGVNAGLEVGYTKGVKDVWQASVKATFNANFSAQHSNEVTSTYTTSTLATLVLPPNRVNVINQMIFNQRTSLPYTAKVKVVPRLRFQNGFTKWGGGSNYRDNPNTNALKVGFGAGTRVYDNKEFKRCDEIRDDARANADPWEWTLCMQRRPDLTYALEDLANASNYEVYVKGKWEGITGKYAVTTVSAKDTALTLLPRGL